MGPNIVLTLHLDSRPFSIISTAVWMFKPDANNKSRIFQLYMFARLDFRPDFDRWL